MPDITMCHGVGCGKKDKCYRHKACADQWQSFFSETPKPPCGHYWPLAKPVKKPKRKQIDTI